MFFQFIKLKYLADKVSDSFFMTSKRDQIWEQKRKAREERINGGPSQGTFENIIREDPNQGRRIEDYEMNFHSPRDRVPPENFNSNRGYEAAPPMTRKTPQTRPYSDPREDFGMDEKVALYNNKAQRDQHTGDYRAIDDEKRKKVEYGEFLQHQMKEKNNSKQISPNPTFQQNEQNHSLLEKESERKKKMEYGQFLRDQVLELDCYLFR